MRPTALVLVLALALAAPAQAAAADGTITVRGTAKGMQYKLVRLFGADSGGYTGEVPEELSDYFAPADGGHIAAKAAAVDEAGQLSAGAVEALTQWAKSQGGRNASANGDEVVFRDLAWGYYVVVCRKSTAAAVSVTAAGPDAVIYDASSGEAPPPEAEESPPVEEETPAASPEPTPTPAPSAEAVEQSPQPVVEPGQPPDSGGSYTMVYLGGGALLAALALALVYRKFRRKEEQEE